MTIENQPLFDDVMAAGAGDISKALATKRVTSEGIAELTKALPADRAKTVGDILRKYEGWTWKSALDAHSAKKPPVTP